jgi:hypothetical protein
VQKVREAANRIKCANNLRQLGIAAQAYNDGSGGRLPPLVDVGPGARYNAGVPSLFFYLLPYLEQDNLYQQFTPASPLSYYGPGGLAQMPVAVFLCPSDPTSPGGPATLNVTLTTTPSPPFATTFSGPYATSSYAANGVLFAGSHVSLPQSFGDGTSNTIVLGEHYQVCQDSTSGLSAYNCWAIGAIGTVMNSFGFLAPVGYTNTNQASPVLPLPADPGGGPIPMLVGAVNGPATTKPVPFQVRPQPGACDVQLAQTPHPGGMQVGLGDGSVRTVSPGVSPWTFWAACTPNGGELLGSDW